MIRSVCFDVGGTLAWSNRPGLCRSIREYLQRDPDAVGTMIDRYLRAGSDDPEKRWSEFFKLFGITGPPSPEDLLCLEGRKMVLYPDTIPALDALAGYHLGVISNVSVWEALDLGVLGLDQYFPDILLSCFAGYVKPSVSIFRAYEKQTGFAPDEILYVGDSIRNDLHGAWRAGWNALHLDRSVVKSAHYRRHPYRIGSLTEIRHHIGSIVIPNHLSR